MNQNQFSTWSKCEEIKAHCFEFGCHQVNVWANNRPTQIEFQ